MSFFLKLIVLFLAITGASTILIRVFNVPFGTTNFWEIHGLLFLFFISTFPRLTLLFSSVVTGGLFWWLGWFFAPRVLVAILATIAYWKTNPILVIISWLIALGGESSEKYYIRRGTFRARHLHGSTESVIEPEYKVID